jgi:hypothetical protein
MTTNAHTKGRESARDRVEVRKAATKITSAADLRRFFKACDLREKGREPDWEDHLKAMEDSRETGRSHT